MRWTSALAATTVALAATACLGGTSAAPPGSALRRLGTAPPTVPHFAFARRPGWHTATTGIGVTAPQAPTAWATTLPARGASTVDPWTTLIPRLRAHPSRIAVVAIVYGRARAASHRLRDEFPYRRLPLRLSEAAVQHRWEGMPGRRIVQLLLDARVRGYDVQLDAYFGTQHPSRAQIATAQREVDGLNLPPPRGQ